MAEEKKEQGGFIFVVEDDRGANTLQARQLAPLGLEVRSAYSGTQALELLKGAQPALMLLDYSLPDMNAPALLAALEKNKISTPPFIVVTGAGDEATAVEMMKVGAEDYLVKDANLLENLPGRAKRALAGAALKRELAQTEAALRESETLHKAMTENIADVIAIMGADGIMKYKSPNIQRWFGWQPQDLVGQEGWQTVHPEDLERIQKEFVSLLGRDKGLTTVEYRYKCKDGSYRPVELTAVNLVSDPAIGGVLMNYRDITERKAQQRALGQSEERYRTLVNNVGSEYFFYQHDAAGVFTFLSPSATGMLGYAAEEFLAHYSDHLTNHPVNKEVQRHTDLSLRGEEQAPYLVEIFHKDGSTRWLEVKETPLRGPDGEVTGVEGLAHDITARKQAQEALQKSAELAQKTSRELAGVLVSPELKSGDIGTAMRLLTEKLALLAAVERASIWQLSESGEELVCLDLYQSSGASHSCGMILKCADYPRYLAAIRSGSRITAANAREHPATSEFKDGYLVPLGIASMLDSVIPGGKDILGVVCLEHAGAIRTWTPEEEALTMSFSTLAANVLETAKQKASEVALNTSEARLRKITGMALGVVYEYRLYPDGRSCFPYASEGMNDIYEVTPEEVREDASMVFGRIHPDDLKQTSDAIYESARTLKDFYCELRMVLPRQGLRWRVSQARPERLPDGSTLWYGTITDITPRKKEELFLDISREVLGILNKSQGLRDAVKSVVTVLRTRGDFDAVGLRLQEKEDFPYFYQEGFPEDFLLTENTLVERAADGGLCRDKDGKVCLECTCGLVISGKPAPVLTKGGTFWTNDSFPLLDLPPAQDPRLHPRNNCVHKNYASVALLPIRRGKAIVGLLQLNSHKKGCFSDSIIAQLENMAASIGEALMRKRAEAEREAIYTELLQARKMESIGRLAGGVAHDFNNLLTAIGGYAGFLLKGLAEDDPRREDAREILNAAERAGLLTKQLLAFSRKQILAPQHIDLNATLAGTVNMLRRIIGEDVKLEVKPASQPCVVNVDTGQIGQVLLNLTVNSRDAMPKGGTIVIETSIVTPEKAFLKTHQHLKPGPLVCLSLSDTGCGISPEDKEHLFEPFFTTKEKGKGTGLGLSTVFGVVTQSGGAIEVESAAGRGTTFRIYLPQAIEAALSNDKDKDNDTLQRGTETVLLAEDEESLRRLSARLLRAAGYTVIAAADGLEAIAAAERHGKPFDLLLTDVVMPGMNGRELARRLADAKLVTRTLYMSGYTDEAVIKHGVLEPGVAFIYKPFTAEALAAKLREVLDGPADKAKA